MSAAIVKTEPRILSGSHQDREERAQRLANLFIGETIPLLVQVRQDFFEKKPAEMICGVNTFTEYCVGVLRYSESHIRRLIAGQNPATKKHNGSENRKPKPPTPQVTDAEFADYEASYGNGIRKSAKNLLDHKGMTPADVVGALVGMSFPKPMAEAAVRIVTGQQPVPKAGPKTWIDYEPNYVSLDNQKQLLIFVNSQLLTPETGDCENPPTHDSIQWGPRQAYRNCVPAEFRVASSGPIPEELTRLHGDVEQRYEAVFNTIQVNRHWNEKSVVLPHSDNMHGDIVMLSLGAPRRFVLRHKHDDKSNQRRWKTGDIYFDKVLPSGSLLTIYKAHQFDLTHEMPAADEPCGVRISLIWRYVAKAVTEKLGRAGLIDGTAEYNKAQATFVKVEAPKNPELEAAARDLKEMLRSNGIDADVSRSKSDGKFHVAWHNATAKQVHKFAETFRASVLASLEQIG